MSINYRDIDSLDIGIFSSQLYNKLSHLNFTGDVSQDVKFFTDCFNQVVDQVAPVKLKRVQRIQQPEWFTNKIKKEIIVRDKLKHDNNIIMYRQQRNKVVDLVKVAKKNISIRKLNTAKETQPNYGIRQRSCREKMLTKTFLPSLSKMVKQILTQKE